MHNKIELTDKTLKDFWIWYLLPEQRKTYRTASLRGNDSVFKIRFLAMPFTKRYDVYVNFFLIVDLNVWVSPKGNFLYHLDDNDKETVWVDPNADWLYNIEDNEKDYSERFSLKLEASAAAIEKANEIHNNKQ
jgi:hypothetical protein